MAKKDKKIKFIRFGGANKVRQTNKRAPVGKGIWCFPLGLVDKFYLGGTGKENASTRIFSYKGDIWVGIGDIPSKLHSKIIKRVNRGDKEWGLVDWSTFKKIYNSHKFFHNKTYAGLYNIPFKMRHNILRKKELPDGKTIYYVDITTSCERCGNEHKKNVKIVVEEGKTLNDYLPKECLTCNTPINSGFECFIP